MDKSYFFGKGNALRVKQYIDDNYPPLTWNIVAIKCVPIMLCQKVNPTELDETSEFDHEVLEALNNALIEKTGKGFPTHPRNKIIHPRGKFLRDRNAYINHGEPMLFHCHHYNCFLLYSIETARHYDIEVDDILINSAQEVVYNQFQAFFKRYSHLSEEEKIHAIEENYRINGFGIIKFQDNGDTVVSESSHYAEGWLSKFGRRKEKGVGFFTAGYIAGALDALVGVLGKHHVTQTKCMTLGDHISEFCIIQGPLKKLEKSVGEGKYQEFDYQNPTNSEIDYIGIREAVLSLKVEGNEKGIISSFGVMLTRMYGNYYTLISYRFVNALKDKIGDIGQKLAEELLIEAGHVCAFNTFGGIMTSMEWQGLVMPMIKTKEDWVHGIIAVANSFGWGRLYLDQLIPSKRMVIKDYSGYESNMFLSKYKKADYPTTFLKIGISSGIMNLVYGAEIIERPELTEEYYDQIFKNKDRFYSTQTKCRSNGFDYDEFVVEKNKKGEVL